VVKSKRENLKIDTRRVREARTQELEKLRKNRPTRGKRGRKSFLIPVISQKKALPPIGLEGGGFHESQKKSQRRRKGILRDQHGERGSSA